MPGAITPTLYISDNPPLNPNQGDLWQRQSNGELQRFDGIKFSALVSVSPQIDGDIFWVENGVTMRLTHAATVNRTVTFPDATGTIPLTGAANNWTALQEFSSGISADGTHTITLPASTGTLALLGLAQNFTALQQFSGGISPNGTNTLTLPAITDTIVTKTSNDVLTNKNLTAPTITGTASITVANGGFISLAAAAVSGGLTVPSAGGAAPTVDTQVAFDTTTHQLVAGANGSTAHYAPTMFSFQGVSAQTQGTTAFYCAASQSSTESINEVIMPFPITFSRLYVDTTTNVGGSGQTVTATLRKNGVDQALTCVVNTGASAGNDTAHTVTYAAGDRMCLKVVTSGTTGSLNIRGGLST